MAKAKTTVRRKSPTTKVVEHNATVNTVATGFVMMVDTFGWFKQRTLDVGKGLAVGVQTIKDRK